jgi:hypothetical protein
MYKKIISGSLVVASLMFSGCGNTDTTCRIDVQNAIDKGNYDVALSKLKGQCASAYTRSDLNMNLAAAYMGKSGYSVSSIVDTLINSGDDNGNAFTSFVSSVDAKSATDSLPLLKSAEDAYVAAIQTATKKTIRALCSKTELNATRDSRRANACLYIGFNEVIKTANTFSYLTGNIDGLVNSISTDQNATPYDMRASLDALAWDYNSSYSPSEGTISSTDVNISGNSFANVKVNYGANGLFYRLAKSTTRDANNSTVITYGYCDVNGNKDACADIENSDGSIDTNKTNASNCYACPVLVDGNNTLDVASLLVNTLNNGSDTIAAVVNDPDISKSIGDFKKEITGSRDGNVTIDNIIKYLQK